MTLLCNRTYTVAGIDWNDPDPEADFTMREVECGKPASYGERTCASQSWPDTLFCDDCFHALGREGQIDIWPLKPEAMLPSSTGESK